MTFSSSVFFFGFFPAFLVCYLVCPIKYRNWVIIFSSLSFYAWGAHSFILIVLGTCVIDFFLGTLIYESKISIPSSLKKQGVDQLSENQKTKKTKKTNLYLFIDVLMNLGLLAYFKYFNFFIGNLNVVFSGLGINPLIFNEVLLPIGISFVIFQKATYCLDIAKGVVKPAGKFSTYIEYLFVFPQIIAGPIVRYNTIASEIEDYSCRKIDLENVKFGFYRFAVGIFKKVWIADVLAKYADLAFNGGAGVIPIHYCWFGAICYTFQIYFDFSGYSDMAIGILKILGFTIPENFNNPYISKSITEFWKRWHISLTTWMREYLYIPLGGNRKGVVRTYLNQWLVFFLSGLWHGASWNFIVWGILHGTFICLEKIFSKQINKIPGIFRVMGTLFFVILGWVIFRSNTLGESWVFIKQMFNFSTINIHPDVTRFMYIDGRGIFIFFIAVIISLLPAFGIYRKIKDFVTCRNKGIIFFCSVIILLLSALKIGTAAVSPFIYFRF
ncbi:MAG: hypothetical protein LBJ31_04980 [Treponema sp.]|jgi:alginate O-acetyltransferase complex protein AlgI|nr:hypothetical protein [Treponema sp.]